MKYLIDTSVLVAGLLEFHPAHSLAFPYLQKIKSGTDQGVITTHSLAELYAVLTRLPIKPRITPILAYQLIETDIAHLFEIVELSADDYLSLLKYLAKVDLKGGIVYDALILTAVKKVDVDQIVTLNRKDFIRIFPHLAEKIIALNQTIQESTL